MHALSPDCYAVACLQEWRQPAGLATTTRDPERSIEEYNRVGKKTEKKKRRKKKKGKMRKKIKRMKNV